MFGKGITGNVFGFSLSKQVLFRGVANRSSEQQQKKQKQKKDNFAEWPRRGTMTHVPIGLYLQRRESGDTLLK